MTRDHLNLLDGQSSGESSGVSRTNESTANFYSRANKRPVSLNEISLQMINEIKHSRYPVTYKDLADRVTRANFCDILAEK